MKIEKINDNQIRCTLTREDLASHQIRLSELAYGTEKAKNLFRDMMQQAHLEFGFEADNIPLMIEAIPVNDQSVILIITKVEDPEELDTRFSKFAPGKAPEESVPEYHGADNIIDVFQKLYEARTKKADSPEDVKIPDTSVPVVNLVYLYEFPTLDAVIRASHGLNRFYQGINSLYKDVKRGEYNLVIHQSSYSPEEFNKVCNILSEYGSGKPFTPAGEAHLQEHSEVIIAKKALQKLVEL